eukprot:m.1367276 g.1367276  ORF g.1367276 m.1367276 type:complete len:190 (-) comp24952_c0_seq80:3157-3726(-)
MVASSPFKYSGSGSKLNAGWGDSSGMVRSPKDGYFYSIVHNRFPAGSQQNGSCVIRTADLTERRHGGRGTALHSLFRLRRHIMLQISTRMTTFAMCWHCRTASCWAWCTVRILNGFVGSMACGGQNGGDGGREFYYATSEDLIHWDTPTELYAPPMPPAVQFYNYPKIMDPDAPQRGDRNFQTIGQNAT